ncbi:transcriptional regulator [Paenibacillus sp. V4I9]|uniref:transcriptional regulator n=1 Tax=Paenibacillus sp. V4I9 TaxID=3042308 RepID=UPI0027D8BE53|nr:transcriptional regulator [Paenibacillus sp. V4I9]
MDKQELIIDEQIQKLNDTKKLLAHHKNQLQEQTRLHDQVFGVVFTRKIDERSVLKVDCKTIVTPLDQHNLNFRGLAIALEKEGTVMAPLCGCMYPLKSYESIEKFHYSSLYTSISKTDLTSLPLGVYVDSIPEGMYMCIAFKRSKTGYYDHFCKLKEAYDLLGYPTENNVYEVSLPNNYASSNDEDFITELQIQIN